MEVFIKVWDEIIRDFAAQRFEREEISGDLSVSGIDMPPSIDKDKVKTSFEYKGKKYWSSDEMDYAQPN